MDAGTVALGQAETQMRTGQLVAIWIGWVDVHVHRREGNRSFSKTIAGALNLTLRKSIVAFKLFRLFFLKGAFRASRFAKQRCESPSTPTGE